MSADPDFRCPVCRAVQTVRETCRRCRADLHLVLRAHQRLAFVKQGLEQARADGDATLEQEFAAELQWLAPRD